jgi:hypothetical protein
MRFFKRNGCTPIKKSNSDRTELDQIIAEKKEIQFYLNMLMGLSATCCVMLPTDAIYATLMELSAQEASLRQQAKDDCIGIPKDYLDKNGS